jgi:hypothetical protein
LTWGIYSVDPLRDGVHKHGIKDNSGVVDTSEYCSVMRRKRNETGLMRNGCGGEWSDMQASSAHDAGTGVEIELT